MDIFYLITTTNIVYIVRDVYFSSNYQNISFMDITNPESPKERNLPYNYVWKITNKL